MNLPESIDHLLVAARWIEAALLGSVADAIAVVAVAVIGLAMLNGRIEVRRAVTIVLGCFVLFCAPVIAAGLLHLVPSQPVASQVSLPLPPLPIPAPKPTAYDPYAGAAVPQAR